MAILQGGNTDSAGEIIVMSFKEPNRAVRTFGSPTYGVTSQPYTYTLADKASVQVTAALMFDRQMKTYYNGTSGQIPPDEPVTGPPVRYDTYVPGTDLANDGVVQAAVSWLNKQTACASAPTAADAASPRARLTPGGIFRSVVPMPGAEPPSAWPKRGTPWSAAAPRPTTH